MKKLLVIVMSVIIFTGCGTQIEESLKSNLNEKIISTEKTDMDINETYESEKNIVPYNLYDIFELDNFLGLSGIEYIYEKNNDFNHYQGYTTEKDGYFITSINIEKSNYEKTEEYYIYKITSTKLITPEGIKVGDDKLILDQVYGEPTKFKGNEYKYYQNELNIWYIFILDDKMKISEISFDATPLGLIKVS